MKPIQKLPKITITATPNHSQFQSQQIRQLIIKINQLQQENHRLHERIAELTDKNEQLIQSIAEKELVIKQLAKINPD